ncbi:MMPL family transporter [Subtercola lobariae]|uniref:Membrane protein n=1 Tax=Subtercola lobariae TaxID=1588641 RepID=A0A917BF00_9MICO|nr:MMPL family transporter [Subtercola lobariae]GGF37561.1 membrane protein [Subtercola lobariae]
MPKLRAIPPRWLRILLPLVVVGIWIFISSQGGPTFGTISEVTNNDQSSYLPASAESTKVQSLETQFFGSDTVPAIVLYTSDAAITPAEQAAVAADLKDIAAIDGVQSVSPAVPSTDGHALQSFVAVASSADGTTVVADMRSVLTTDPAPGLTSYVTGPAALGADFGAGFAGIDGILLLVALAAVFVILLIVYRSLLLPVIVLLTSAFALTGSILLVYAVAKAGWVTVTGQSRGILAILAIGAATDYSLLIVSRYREALRFEPSAWAAMVVALRRAAEPVAASAATVILAVLCLLFSDLNSNKGLGPVAAIAIAFSFLAAMTALPAMLLLAGRAAFWPFMPKLDAQPAAGAVAHSTGGADAATTGSATTGVSAAATASAGAAASGGPLAEQARIPGLWGAVGRMIARRPRVVWIVTVLLLGFFSLGLLQLSASGVPQTDLLLSQSQSVDGQKALAQHYDAGSGSPVVVIAPQGEADAALSAVSGTAGLTNAFVYTGSQGGAPAQPGATTPPPVVVNDQVLIEATLTDAADSDAAQQVVIGLRDQLATSAPGSLVGGVTALALDTNTTALRDLATIIPIVLLVILVVLMLLLRAIVAPLLLIGTVVLSYSATLGISAVVFNHVFDFPGADPSVPLFGFVFLVALGVDYNIFLMTRVREESLVHGTRPGILRGLAATGGVITSAGIVLAATFAALGVVPILFLVQIAFIVAFGVLLDTFLVRSLVVPALSYDIGARIWWPSKLAKSSGSRHLVHAGVGAHAAVATVAAPASPAAPAPPAAPESHEPEARDTEETP